jgi:hypothetical protein
MKKPVGRLAMRVEGNLWVAYYALPDTMKGAIFLGSIQMRFVEDKGHKDTFLDLMKEAVSDIYEGDIGIQLDWPEGPQPAPESERSGNA